MSSYTLPTLPSPGPDTKDCKLHNSYDAQSCVLAAVCVLIGTILCFLGYRVFKFVLFLSGFLLGFFITYMLCSGYLADKMSGKALEHEDQIFLGVSLGVGIFAGLLTLCLFYLGLFVLGATMGWFVGMFFLPFLSKHSEYLAEHNWLPYFILLAFAIAGGIFILCVQKAILTNLFCLTAGTRGWFYHSSRSCSLLAWWYNFARLEKAVITDKLILGDHVYPLWQLPGSIHQISNPF